MAFVRPQHGCRCDDKSGMSVASAEAVVTCGSCGSKLHVACGAEARTQPCPTCGTRLQIEARSDGAPDARRVTLASQGNAVIASPTEGTFLFFPARAAEPEIRSVPGKARTGSAVSRANVKAIWIGLVTIAALFIGMTAGIAIVRFGGTELWVVKRSAVAWMVGMFTAAAMIFALGRRDASIRLLALTTAAASVVLARQVAGPAAFGPVDLLLAALAMAGSVCGFILAEGNFKTQAR